MLENEKSSLFQKRFTNSDSFSYSIKLGFWDKLLETLNVDDLTRMAQEKIFIHVVKGSATTTLIGSALPNNSKLISIHYNSFKQIRLDEQVAIILHELGHAFNPDEIPPKNEIVADSFAVQKGYGNVLLESLQRIYSEGSPNCDLSSINERCELIKRALVK